MTLDDIESLVGVQLGATGVSAEQRFVEDLGAESADIVNIIAAVEDRYGIEIGEEEIPDLLTVRDLFELVSRRLSS